MSSSLIGKSLGQYEIVSLIGEGGMGEVYAARDTRLGRMVALKTLPPSMSNVPGRRTRFEREAKAVAALSHPNIVTLYSIEEIEGLHFLTMELVEGTSLRQLVPDHGLSPERLFELAIPIVDAVAAAHRKGIAHRDLKPDNVMVTAEGRVKVLDFGLAKLLDPLDSGRTVPDEETSDGTGTFGDFGDRLPRRDVFSARPPTCPRSNPKVSPRITVRTSSPWASSSTPWRPASGRFEGKAVRPSRPRSCGIHPNPSTT